jgi:hypothetical protein
MLEPDKIEQNGTMENKKSAAYPVDIQKGLTKREYFAGLAMQGLLANSGGVIQANEMSGTGWCNGDAESMAQLCIESADALLKELDKE